MIDQVTQVFSAVLTFDHLTYFVAGIAAAWTWQTGKAMMRHKQVKINWRKLIIALGVIVLAYITVSTHRASECITEFNRTLRVRADINDQDQAVSLEQRKVLYNWMHSIVFPPPDIARLDRDDPVRQQFILGVTIDTDHKLAESFAQQSDNEQARAAHPLPTPTCQ